MPPSGARPRRRFAALIVAATVLLSGVATVLAQPAEPVPAIRSADRVLIDLASLARRYGWSVSGAADAFTVRTGSGILTLFAASPDALWQPTGAAVPVTVPLSMPPEATAGAWYAPADALEVIGVAVTGDAVEVPAGTAPLAFPPQAAAGAGYEVVDLGHGVRALRVFRPGAAAPDGLSMLIADLALLALALPEHQDVLDRVLMDGPMATDHPLLVTVTALEPVAWEASLVFEQAGLRFEARHPFRFQLVEGDVDRVAPGRPAVGVALVPARFSLEAPLTVRWSDVAAEVTFRPGR